jgi:hypothetical protein
MRTRSAFALAASAVAVAIPAPAASAASTTTVSANWAGYAATGARFKRVTGGWTVPKGTCTSGETGYSAAWVGLGGFSESSRALEQTGTELDCTRTGRASYTAWYELVPAPARTIRLAVRAGDRIAAAVTVQGKHVTLTLRDRSTGASFQKRATMSAPDVTSAEWIVEAPEGCDGNGRCTQLPLGNFGTVTFAGAGATNTAGRTGGISRWPLTRIQLDTTNTLISDGPGASSASGAVTTGLRAGGSAFSVSYRSQAASPTLVKARTMLPARR